ncbi:MAG TPA: TPM domain-containing protein [Prolixibacteraceae bacterium]|nr:TPM domain-containing protein [Prolixibacteraceae bacterium]
MTIPSKFFNEEEKKQIAEAIQTAELNTSGEIRLHVESKCADNELDRAAYWFAELKMHKTEQRNGVLFYLAIDDKKLAILGDIGINAKVENGFWDATRDLIIGFFKEGKYAMGLTTGIIQAGLQLQKHFPYQTDDVNELADEISYGK